VRGERAICPDGAVGQTCECRAVVELERATDDLKFGRSIRKRSDLLHGQRTRGNNFTGVRRGHAVVEIWRIGAGRTGKLGAGSRRKESRSGFRHLPPASWASDVRARLRLAKFIEIRGVGEPRQRVLATIPNRGSFRTEMREKNQSRHIVDGHRQIRSHGLTY